MTPRAGQPEQAITGPHLIIEAELEENGYHVVAGVDEAGRGPLAGPVHAAAVILDPRNIPDGLDDSKRLSAARRARIAAEIRQTAQYSVASASVGEIDDMNILQATMLAMRRAVAGLAARPDFVLIDGNRIADGLPCPARAVVGGDRLSASVAAASIVAKVTRDGCMLALDRLYPQYEWRRNNGYGTARHLEALRQFGPSRYHRQSFAPVRAALAIVPGGRQ